MTEAEKTRGLYNKYRVERVDGKYPDAQYLVLRVGDPCAPPAIRAYAAAARAAGYGALADDLGALPDPTPSPVDCTGLCPHCDRLAPSPVDVAREACVNVCLNVAQVLGPDTEGQADSMLTAVLDAGATLLSSQAAAKGEG